MKKQSILSIALIILFIVSIFTMPQTKALAEEADGIYSIDYQVLKADGDGVSIGNDYFVKPATLVVENGVKHIQLTIKNSEWVKALSGPNGAVSVISENKAADTRAVKFKVDDISKPITMEMHIEFVNEEMDYNQTHKARFDFDQASVKAIGDKVAPNKEEADEAKATGEKKEDNPPTSDHTPIAMFVFLLVASSLVIFISMRSIRTSK